MNLEGQTALYIGPGEECDCGATTQKFTPPHPEDKTVITICDECNLVSFTG